MANNPQEPDTALQESAERTACDQSRRWLFERHHVIQDKVGNLRLMAPLKLAQRKLLAVMEMCQREKIPSWIIIGKSRKEGISTFVAADALTEAVNRGIEVLVVAHERDSSAYLLGIYSRFFEYLDQSMVPGVPKLTKPYLFKGQTNKYEIRFTNGGKIEIDTANNIDAGRGRTPQYIHGSECARWANGSATASSLSQSIVRIPGTVYIMESTFYGEDSLFWPTWDASFANAKVTFTDTGGQLDARLEIMNHDDWNGWIPLFISVLEDEDATLAFRNEDDRMRFAGTLDAYEKMVLDRMGGSLEFLNLRMMQIKVTCQNDIAIFKREFPATPDEALQVSNKRARFDYPSLDLQIPNLEEGERGELRFDSWRWKIKWHPDPNGIMIRYRTPKPNHRYVIGIDVAEGKDDKFGKEQDASVLGVWDLDSRMEQAAVIYGSHINEEDLIPLAVVCGGYYNGAFIIPENNSTAKHLCIELGKQYPDDRLFRMGDDIDGRHTGEVGHRTHVGTKSKLIGRLADAITSNDLIIHCKKTLNELFNYEKSSGGGTAARAGHHDDHCFREGTLITCQDGYKPIETIKVGDYVLTHKNRYKKILAAGAHEFDGEFHCLQFRGQFPLHMSFNHRLLVATTMKTGREQKRKWIVPAEICKEYRNVCLIDNARGNPARIHTLGLAHYPAGRNDLARLKSIQLDDGFARLLGRFLADGTRSPNARKTKLYTFSICFEVSDKSIDGFHEYLSGRGIKARVYPSPVGLRCVYLDSQSKLLWHMFDECYDDEGRKQLPWYAYRHMSAFTGSILDEWLAGDGWPSTREPAVYGCTISMPLALAMRDLAWATGRYASVQMVKRHRYGKPTQPQFWLRIGQTAQGNKQRLLSQSEFGSRIKVNDKYHFAGTVYDLQVEDDESFIANGMIVHNCMMTALAITGAMFYPATQQASSQPEYVGRYAKANKAMQGRNQLTGY